MLLRGTVGPQVLSDGVTNDIRTDRYGGQVMTQLMPRYSEAAARKQIFIGCVPGIAGQTTSAGLTATYVGCCLYNPPGSAVNAHVIGVSWAWSVIAAAINMVGFGTGYHASTAPTIGTAGTVTSSYIGATVLPACGIVSTSTLPTTLTLRGFLGDTPTATTNPNGGYVDMAGAIVLPPGGFIATVTVTASSALAFWASWTWMEVPQ